MNRNVVAGVALFALAAIFALILSSAARGTKAPSPPLDTQWKLILTLPKTNSTTSSPDVRPTSK